MRLDHLLSMETMTDHHGFVVVGGWRRPKGHGSGFEDLLLFSFQGSDSRETGCLFFERKELLDGGVAQLEEHQARVSGWSSGLDSRWDTTSPKLWGCSSAGRAPALQAGGHGFDSHHLHHFLRPNPKDSGLKNDENGVNRSHSYPAGYEEHAKARRTRKREIARVWVLIPIISTRSNRRTK